MNCVRVIERVERILNEPKSILSTWSISLNQFLLNIVPHESDINEVPSFEISRVGPHREY